ncbi:hypothetical protein PN500_09185 [Dolichospermum circinale CS-541/06]|uniref:hypothetical protein n=1 Tax=Dolichospermum circinale TaxID=109265 RepID=UPI00232B5DE6|nr:hypothetical protein [Dolichospermum circinale]MDB9454462.1 hypothetical protein [Dolichospermum circinale CS-541/06]MDB9546928.1 hypothetical protein [Dolichospermum circinale CS-1031]
MTTRDDGVKKSPMEELMEEELIKYSNTKSPMEELMEEELIKYSKTKSPMEELIDKANTNK